MSADTLTLAEYRARLVEARSLLLTARSGSSVPTARADLSARARALLTRTTALRVGDALVTVRDEAIVPAEAGDEGLARAIADLDLLVVTVEAAGTSPIGAARSDAALREVRAATAGVGVPLPQLIVRAAVSAVARLLSSLPGITDALSLAPLALGTAGLAVAALVVLLLGRRLPERFRREGARASSSGAAARADPAERLSRAESLRAAGRVRESLHELYRYALDALAARGTLRFDPALTDRELLARLAAVAPEAAGLRELVALHDRAWYGLREPAAGELDRARSLAERAAR